MCATCKHKLIVVKGGGHLLYSIRQYKLNAIFDTYLLISPSKGRYFSLGWREKDLLTTSQALLPLSHWDPVWQRSRVVDILTPIDPSRFLL